MKRAFLFAVLTAGCGGSMIIPVYESESVYSWHPGLRGRVSVADQYQPLADSFDKPGDVLIVGMVNYEGKISADRAHNLRQLFAMAGGLSKLACLPQIIVVRPSENRAVLCDYYRYALHRDVRQNLALRAGDIVVVPRIYSEERNPVAREWSMIERFLTRAITVEELFQALNR